MIRSGIVGLAVIAALTAGCSVATPGTDRNLGRVQYADAFATGREVMSQYYSIASADATSGVIRARPKSVDAPSERILSNSPARQVAKLSIVGILIAWWIIPHVFWPVHELALMLLYPEYLG